MNFFKNSQTSWKYILIVTILAAIVGGGILAYQYWWLPKEEVENVANNINVQKDETADWKTYKGGESFRISVPPNYPNPEEYKDIFESFLYYEFYDVNHFSELSELPVISSIGFVSEESIQRYVNDNNLRNERINKFYEQKKALNNSNDYSDNYEALKFKKINDYSYLVSSRGCGGDIYGCSLIKYTTFVDNIQINVSVGFDENTTNSAMDKLVSQIKIIREDETAGCSPIDFSGYELAKAATGTTDYEFNVDLNNDGKKEIVRVYQTPANEFGERMGPNMIKIFSGTKDCPKEEFSYLGKGNFVWKAETVLNFWGDGINAVMVQDASYGGGCGGTTRLVFFIYREGKYSIVEGPQFGGLGGVYMFDGKNGLGKKIIVAEERWDWTSDPPDYCCGCASRRQFMIYTWNGAGYTKNEAGITQNKYSPEESIDEIIQEESSVLNLQ